MLRAALTWLLSMLVRGYQGFIRPWLPPACRYTPTCSEYALDALRLHGPFHGTALATRRVCRCHPWGGGGYDPVPLPPPTDAAAIAPASQEPPDA